MFSFLQIEKRKGPYHIAAQADFEHLDLLVPKCRQILVVHVLVAVRVDLVCIVVCGQLVPSWLIGFRSRGP